MKSAFIGRAAENAVALALASKKYQILEQNWRRRTAEIDLIAKSKKVVYFVEVKYRGSDGQGSGLEYITPKKLNQIKYAVRLWCAENDWNGDCRILGAEVSGAAYEKIEIVEI